MKQPIAEFRAAAELFTIFSLGCGIDALFFQWSGFSAVQPNPWWAVVLVVAWRHGTVYGLFTVALVTLQVWLAQGLINGMEWKSVSLSLGILKEPLAWLVAAVLVGELRRAERARFMLLNAQMREAQIGQQHAWDDAELLRKRNEDLLGQLQAQTDVAQFAYRAIRRLERVTAETFGEWMRDVVVGVLHPRSFSVFFVDESGLRRGLVWGGHDDLVIPSNYGKDTTLYREVIEQGRVLCVANPSEAELMEKFGVLAGPIRAGAQGTVIGLIKIESIDFSRLNDHAVASVRMIGEWIGAAVTELRQKNENVATKAIIGDEFTSNRGTRQPLVLIDGLAKRIGFAVSVIIIELHLLDDLDSDSRHSACTAVARALSELRVTDYLLPGDMNEGRYVLVLAKTTEKEAKSVAQRVKALVRRHLPAALQDLPISTRVETWPGQTQDPMMFSKVG